MEEQISIEKKELKIPSTIEALIEALIFAAREPLTVKQIKSIFNADNVQKEKLQQIDGETIQRIINDLNKKYERSNSSYRIINIAEGYQFATLPVYADWLGKLRKEQQRRKLSQSGVETLAIIAYKQPITKADIERIRGVNCDYVIKTLLEKELITVTGRADTVGRPLFYGTTKEFLKHFGLKSIVDLPRPREIEEILGESQFETERRMLEAETNAEKIKKEEEENFKSRLPHIPKKKLDLNEKEVKIFPREKTQGIKVLSADENISKLEEDARKLESSELGLYTENTQKEISISSENNIDIKDDQHLVIEETKDIKQDLLNVLNETNISKADSAESIQEENKIEVNTQNIKQNRRWVMLKDKIVHFIKKLFA